jgi:hypothetical protein
MAPHPDRPDPRLERWLAAEAAGRLDDAEAALAALFAAVPRLAPPPGFAERVVLAVAPLSPAHPTRSTLGFRLAVAACLALVALAAPSVAGLAGLAGGWLAELSVAGLLAGATAALVAAAGGVADVVAGAGAVWQDLARVGGWAAAAAATPVVATALAAGLATAVVAFRLLAGLFAHERSWSHVR